MDAQAAKRHFTSVSDNEADRRSPNVEASSQGTIVRAVMIGWALASLILTLAMADSIATLRFPDPDDAMRLLEVRDWLAGQSWWDVAQHRFNHGQFPMHWSRLVDIPLAIVLTLAAPLGEAAATRVAMVSVPLVSLLAAMALLAQITRRLAGEPAARYAVLLVPLSAPLIYQLRPMRIDHHGWQVVLTLAAVSLLLSRPTVRNGALAGLALASLLTISLEGMPMAASVSGVAALAWAWQPHRRPFLLGLLWSLFVSALLLHVATRGPAFLMPACDAVSPGWLAMLGTAALAVSAGVFAGKWPLAARLGVLVACGSVTLAALVLAAPACLAGPFATLPPIVHDIWYLGVSEGRPLWEQKGDWAAMTMGLPLVGLFASWRAWRASTGEAKMRWALLLGVLGAATALALLVNRAGATANALAIPGAATMLVALLVRARAQRTVGMRIVATAGVFLLVSPGQAAAIGMMAAKALAANSSTEGQGRGARRSCERVGDARAIGRWPPAMVFAPIDIGPDILATTHHRGITGGYHRAPDPMATVLRAFTGKPEEARRLILASGADYLVACPGMNETETYRRDYPAGLWARLDRGDRFDWLEPISLGTPAMAWRVIRPLPAAKPHP